MEKCYVCRRVIGDEEMVCAIEQHVACGECWTRLHWPEYVGPEPVPLANDFTGVLSEVAARWNDLKPMEFSHASFELFHAGNKRGYVLLWAMLNANGARKYPTVSALGVTWGMIHHGLEGRGSGMLDIAGGAEWEAVAGFISALFGWRYRDLLHRHVCHAALLAARRKDAKAAAHMLDEAILVMDGWPDLFSPPIVGADDRVKRAQTWLEKSKRREAL